MVHIHGNDMGDESGNDVPEDRNKQMQPGFMKDRRVG